MGVEVELTTLAERQVRELRGKRLRAFDAFMADIEGRGCAAMSGRTGYETDRAIVAFESPELAVVIAVGAHLEGDPRNVYTTLWDALGLAPPPSDESLKPNCCDADGAAPLLPPSDIGEVMKRCKQLVR